MYTITNKTNTALRIGVIQKGEHIMRHVGPDDDGLWSEEITSEMSSFKEKGRIDFEVKAEDDRPIAETTEEVVNTDTVPITDGRVANPDDEAETEITVNAMITEPVSDPPIPKDIVEEVPTTEYVETVDDESETTSDAMEEPETDRATQDLVEDPRLDKKEGVAVADNGNTFVATEPYEYATDTTDPAIEEDKNFIDQTDKATTLTSEEEVITPEDVGDVADVLGEETSSSDDQHPLSQP